MAKLEDLQFMPLEGLQAEKLLAAKLDRPIVLTKDGTATAVILDVAQYQRMARMAAHGEKVSNAFRNFGKKEKE